MANIFDILLLIYASLSVGDLPVYHEIFEVNKPWITDNLFFFKIKAKVTFDWEGTDV
jgi:hypothetical protein